MGEGSLVSGQGWLTREPLDSDPGLAGQRSGSLVTGQGSLVSGQGSLSGVTDQGSLVKVNGLWSMVTGQIFQGPWVIGQESVVKGHDQGSEVVVKGHLSNDFRGQASWVKSQWSRVIGQGSWSGVTGQRSGSLFRGQWSLVSGQGSLLRGHWSESKVTGRVRVKDHGTRVSGHVSVVKGHWSEVKGHWTESRVSGHWSTVTDQTTFYHYPLYKWISSQMGLSKPVTHSVSKLRKDIKL